MAELTSVAKIVLQAFGNSLSRFTNAVGNISVTVVPDNSIGGNPPAWANSPFDQINYEHRILTGTHRFGMVHEFGHQFDWQGHENNNQKLQWRSQQFVDNPAINININKCTAGRIQCRSLYADIDSRNGIFPVEAYANAFAAHILGNCSQCNVQAEKLSIIQNDIQGVP